MWMLSRFGPIRGISVDDIVEQCRWATPAMMEHYDDARDERRDGVVVTLSELARDALTKSSLPTRTQEDSAGKRST
jgi:hypothetical protein